MRTRSFLPLLLIVSTALCAQAATLRILPFESSSPDQPSGPITKLLSSRLEARGITIVSGDRAEFTLSGSFTAIGPTFSIDTSLTAPDGRVVARPFVEGSKDTLIGSVGTLAGKIADIVSSASTPSPPSPAPPLAPSPLPQPPPPKGGAVQQMMRIEGVMVGIAPVVTLPDRGRELVIASANRLVLYRADRKLTPLSTMEIDRGAILSVDSIDLDGDGAVEICATIMDQEILRSAIYEVRDGRLSPRLSNLPWYFRVVDHPGGKRVLYGQEISSDEDYYGPVTELKLEGGRLVKGAPLSLPRGVTIHRFSFFPGVEGGLGIVAIDSDNHLRLYSPGREELWQGSDRVGGSETHFLRDEQQMQQKAFDRYRRRFLEPRMGLTETGELIVPRNDGVMVLGDSRTYSRNSFSRYGWNGATLVETGTTPESPSYLADWFLDRTTGEIVTLEVVQRDGLFRKGASALGVRLFR